MAGYQLPGQPCAVLVNQFECNANALPSLVLSTPPPLPRRLIGLLDLLPRPIMIIVNSSLPFLSDKPPKSPTGMISCILAHRFGGVCCSRPPTNPYPTPLASATSSGSQSCAPITHHLFEHDEQAARDFTGGWTALAEPTSTPPLTRPVAARAVPLSKLASFS